MQEFRKQLACILITIFYYAAHHYQHAQQARPLLCTTTPPQHTHSLYSHSQPQPQHKNSTYITQTYITQTQIKQQRKPKHRQIDNINHNSTDTQQHCGLHAESSHLSLDKEQQAGLPPTTHYHNDTTTATANQHRT